MKQFFKSILPDSTLDILRRIFKNFSFVTSPGLHNFQKILTPFNVYKNRNKINRKLEIGPGLECLDGFETMNIIGGKNIDYVINAGKKLPFNDESFELIYASHVLEHLPWYHVEDSLKEWFRVLKKNGALELFVPDGLKVCNAFVLGETQNSNLFMQDDWYKFNSEKDPCVWANGRIFSYGGGDGERKNPNWHMSLFSERYLNMLLLKIGFKNIEKLSSSDVRGHDHGWINLGLRAIK